MSMKADEIRIQLEQNYGWNFSSEESMEMYYELFLDVQKVVLRSNFVLISKSNYKSKDGSIKKGILIDGDWYAPINDC